MRELSLHTVIFEPGAEHRRYTSAFGPAVDMNSHREAGKTEYLWTFGLLECTATLAFRGDRVMLAHYSPSWEGFHKAVVQAFRPERLIVVAPGDWVKIDDKWELVQREPWNIGEERVAYNMAVSSSECMADRMVQYIAGVIRLPGTGISAEEMEDIRGLQVKWPILSERVRRYRGG